MKSLIFSSLIMILMSSVSFAGVRELANWTMQADSVQAVLYDVLESAAQADAQSRYPQNTIVRKQNALVVQSELATLSCEAKTLGMAMAMSYRCSLKGNISTLTNDAGSVQAVLYEALSEALAADQKSPYPSKVIKRKNAALIVTDAATSITCTAGTRGVAQVQNYACEIK